MPRTTSSTTGVVTINDAPLKSKLYRFCEKKIGRWAREVLQTEGLEDEPIDFKVSFIEEEETRQVSCETEIHHHGHTWRGCDLASDASQAFIQCMKRLQPH